MQISVQQISVLFCGMYDYDYCVRLEDFAEASDLGSEDMCFNEHLLN